MTTSDIRWLSHLLKRDRAAWQPTYANRPRVRGARASGCCAKGGRSLRGVREAGCVRQPTATGGGKGRCEPPGLRWVNTLLGNIKRSLDGTFHACGPQYAGRYPAACASRINRCYHLAAFVPRLTHIVVWIPPLPARLLTLAETAG